MMASGKLARTLLFAVISVAVAQPALAADDVAPLLHAHASQVRAIALSPDETRAISSSERDGIRLWDVTTNKELAHFSAHRIGDLYPAYDVQFTPDGAFAVSGGQDKAVEVWNLTTLGSEQRMLEHPWGVNAVAVSPRGDAILSGGQGGTLILWDRATGKSICHLVGHERMFALTGVAFSNDSRNAISASQDDSVRTWDLATCKQLSAVENKAYSGGPIAMAISSNLAASHEVDRKTIVLWELGSGREILKMSGHTMEIREIKFSPDGRRIISGGQDKRLLTWDVATGELIREQLMPTEITSMAISRTGKFALVGGKDGIIYRASLE